MKARYVVLAVLLAASTSGAAEAPRTHSRDARVAQIKGALGALADAPPGALQHGAELARALERGACSAGTQRVRVECLIVAARRYCAERAEPGCPLFMDVIVGNVLADEHLIPPDQRYRIIRENTDYRPALAKELHRIQGALAVDFRLHAGEAKDRGTLAANVDRYCLTSADETQLAYQICVTSLIWFIQGAP